MKGPGSNYSRGLCDMFKARHFALKKKGFRLRYGCGDYQICRWRHATKFEIRSNSVDKRSLMYARLRQILELDYCYFIYNFLCLHFTKSVAINWCGCITPPDEETITCKFREQKVWFLLRTLVFFNERLLCFKQNYFLPLTYVLFFFFFLINRVYFGWWKAW